MVRSTVWKAAGMEGYGGCLCIGCLEERLGRKLKPKDFMRDHEFNAMPGTERLLNRASGQPRPPVAPVGPALPMVPWPGSRALGRRIGFGQAPE